MQTRLPDDHYRYIVCHVQDRKDILSLRLTSRALGYEAAKVLYRTVEIKAFTQSVCLLLSYLSESRHTAAHVERFSITFEPGVPFWDKPQSASLIRGFLRKADNLKELCILTTGNVDMTLGELTEGVKFNLRHLRCNLPASEGCSRFVESQPGIVDLCWLSDSGPTVTHTHLPNLTTLENGKNTDFLMAFLPSSKVVRLKHPLLKYLLRGTFHTIEVLHMARWATREDVLPQLFPNLRYLSASFHKLSDVPDIVRELFKLQKLVIHTYPIRNQDTKFAMELYSTLLHSPCPSLH